VEAMRPLVWIAGSKQDLKDFPQPVQRAIGFALYRVQQGRTPVTAKPLKGFGGAGVLEIVDDWDGATYRAVYTVRLLAAIYVLHAFQKKSTHGIPTPRHEIELVRARLRQAEMIDAERRTTHNE
jgi:phage-related protein